MERERARAKAAESPSSNVEHNGRQTPTTHGSTDAVASSHSARGASISDAAHPATADDNESVQGDTLNTVGSASSHTSTASSVFSSSARQDGLNGLQASKTSSSQSHLTPLTTVESPSSSISPNPAKQSTLTPRSTADHVNGSASQPASAAHISSSFGASSTIERVSARDHTRAVKGIKCAYDPLLDRTISSAEKKKAKPIYKEFGAVCTHIIIHSTRQGERHLT